VADHDLERRGRTIEGVSLVTEGDIPQGMSRLDEAAVGALGGRTELLFTVSFVLCHLVYACESARDFDRATQWCARLKEYSDQMGFAFAQGTCRAHYASILLWRGMWKEAEAELNDASRLLARSRPPWESEARVRLAELRRRQGRVEEAEALFQEVSWHPLAPLGLAELALSSGRTIDALELLDQMLRSLPPSSAASRAAALDVQVRARIAAGDIEGARVACTELNEIAERVDTQPLKAACHALRGHIAMASGEYDDSRRSFEDAAALFTRCKAPYETALSRLGLATALQRLGREQRAAAEADLALKSFRSLGAYDDAEAAAALVAPSGASTTGESVLTPRQIDVLRLIARGMSDREIAIELVMSEHTVHRHVANILQRLSLPSRAAAVGHASAHGWL
jgi:ATP/maltotriose-dependent transcriptional regulator MalT